MLLIIFLIAIVFIYKAAISIAPWRKNQFLFLSSIGFVTISLGQFYINYLLLNFICFLTIIIAASIYSLLYIKNRRLNFPTLAKNGIKSFNINFPQQLDVQAVLNARRSNAELAIDVNNLKINIFRLEPYAGVKLPQNITWKEDPYNDRTWSWQLHNLSYIADLAIYANYSNNNEYYQLGEDLLLKWIKCNSFYCLKPPSEFSWHDHSTAFRLMNILCFYALWSNSDIAKPATKTYIFRSILGHVNMLSSESFYTFNHNHGIDQDRALLLFSVVFPQLELSHTVRKLAIKRLRQQIEHGISSSGVHLEHSPHYHVYSIVQLIRVVYLLSFDESTIEFQTKLTEKIKLMLGFLEYIIKPNTELVQVGDSKKLSILDFTEDFLPIIQKYTQYSSLEEIVRSHKTGHCYQAEGYAILRANNAHTDEYNNSFYLFFIARAHQGYGHRQADDLSFTLFHRGRDILIDPGVYSYKQDDFRKYVNSAFSHNSVIIDNKTYQGFDTRLELFQHNAEFSFIKASHGNYKGFIHQRFLLNLPLQHIITIDRIINEQPDENTVHSFKQLFHCAPDLVVQIRDKVEGVEISSGKNRVAVIKQHNEVDNMSIICGQREPTLMGWHCLTHGEMVPSPTLISECKGDSALFITSLSCFDNYDGNDLSISEDKDEANIIDVFSRGRHYLVDLEKSSVTYH